MDRNERSATSSIEATIIDYIEGWYEGDVARMDRSLHDDLVKRIPEDAGTGELREVSKERMVRLTEEGGGGTPGATYEIEVHHVSGPIACARVRSLDYLDYLQLIRTDRGWQIANVLFRTHD